MSDAVFLHVNELKLESDCDKLLEQAHKSTTVYLALGNLLVYEFWIFFQLKIRILPRIAHWHVSSWRTGS